ncbi:MAG: MFS transporter [Myxococcota bacterium]
MSWRDEVRALSEAPRELWLVYAVKLFESIAYFTVYTLLAIFLSEDLGYSDTEAGAVTGTWLTAVSVMVFGAGFVADAMGVRKALFVAVLSTAVGRGLLALSGNETGVLLGLAASVWGIGCLKPTMNAAVRAYTTAQSVAYGFSFYYVMMNLGAVAQGPIISQFRTWFKAGATLYGREFSSSELVFLVGFVVSCLNLGLVALMREPARDETHAPKQGPLAIARDVLKERAFWAFLLFVALLTFVRLIFQHAHLTWPKYTLRAFAEDFPFATYWSINPAMIIVMTPFVTAFTRRFRPYPVIVVGATISALSVFAMAFSTTVAASVVFIVTLSIGEALWSPRLYEYTATIAPRGREASYMGLSEVPMFVAKPIVGWLSGWLLTAYCPSDGCHSPEHMWLVVGAMTLAAPVFMLVFRRKLEA